MTQEARLYGTRAIGTEPLVYRILQTKAFRTVPIVARLLAAAVIGIKPGHDDFLERAKNVIDRIAKYGESAIPTNEFDLACWSDLAVSGAEKIRKGGRPRKYRTPEECRAAKTAQQRVYRNVAVWKKPPFSLQETNDLQT